MANKFSEQILQLLADSVNDDITLSGVGPIIGYSGGFFSDNILGLCGDIDSLQFLRDFKETVACLMAALSDDDLVELGFVKE